MSDDVNRREFLKKTTAAGIGMSVAASGLSSCSSELKSPPTFFTVAPLEKVRVGFVGIGHQGSGHVRNLLRIPGVELAALCDIVPDKVAQAQEWAVEAGQARPVGYSHGHEDFRRMCAEEDLDLVYTATPWSWHAPVMLEAMRNGKHAATEIPMAISLDQCWELVETSEKTQRHCVAMENCCYDRVELMILNMVRQNLFGELLHAECGYLHDLRELKLSDFYEEEWRIRHSIARDADLYPTHGFGPVTQWMDINRGNRLDHLVSMSSQSRGLNLYAEAKYGADSPEARQTYALGDVVTTLVQTHRGQTILITHDTDSPRPYTRKVLLQGTKGVVRKYPEALIHIEGRTEGHNWEELAGYQDEFEHPLWREEMRARAEGAGHGGMDYLEDYRLITCLLEGTPTDMDVYDGAMQAAVIDLSERSIAGGSRPVDCPDFTRGAWRNREPLGIVEG
jgi:predicted dehydrogenase